MSNRNLIRLLASLAIILVARGDAGAATDVGNAAGAGVLGSPPTVISVDPFAGSSSSGYTFEVPPGRSGIQPDLTIRYSSGRVTQGLVGKGWDLTFPFIQRSTRNGQPTFNAADRFAIQWNGALLDLVLRCDPSMSGTPCVAGGFSEYHSESEHFIRARSFSVPPAITRWEVEDGLGRKYTFGQDEGSGVPAQVGNFRWNLNRIEDVFGNYMTVRWWLDQGTLYPSRIDYAAHKTSSGTVDMQPTNGVEFAYEGRNDVVVNNLGSVSQLAYRLRRIRTWAGSASQFVSVYLIDYTTPTSGSHPVDLCAASGCGGSTVVCPNGHPSSCSNPCDPNSGFCTGQVCTPVCTLCTGITCAPTVHTCAVGATSCDNTCNLTTGACSTCVPDPCPRNCPKCTGGLAALNLSDASESPFSGAVFTPVGTPAAAAATYSPSVDGPSLLSGISRYDGSGSASLPPTSFTYLADVPAQKAWGAGIQDVPVSFLYKESTATARNTDDHGVQIADLNRDGLPDLIQGFRNGCGGAPTRRVWLNTGSTWLPAAAGTWQLPEDFVVHDCGHEEYETGMHLLDINGDGFVDLVQSLTNTNGVWTVRVWLSTGTNWGALEPAGKWAVPEAFTALESSSSTGVSSRDIGVRFGDVNGDGLVDLVRSWDITSGANSRKVYLLDKTRGWVLASGWSVPLNFVLHVYGGEDAATGTDLVDVNGDGMADLIRAVDYEGTIQKLLYLSTGSSFVQVTDWTIPEVFGNVTNTQNGSKGDEDSDDYGVRFADVNGDGLVDMVVARQWEGSTFNCSAPPSTCQRVLLHRGGKGWVEDPTWASSIPSTWFFIEHRSGAEDYDDGVRLADIDGNGTIDLIKAMDGYRGGTPERRMNADGFSDLLASVANGLGGTTTLSYASSASFPTGRGGTPASLGFTLPVVTRTTMSDGVPADDMTTTYTYEGGYYHYARRDFRGFRYVRTTQPGGRAFTEQLYLQDRTRDIAPLVGSVERQTSGRTSDGKIFSLTLNTFDETDAGPTYFHFLKTADQYLYDWGTTLEITTATGAGAVKYTRSVFAFTRDATLERLITSRQTQTLGDVTTANDDLTLTEELLNNTTTAWRIGLVKHRFTTPLLSDAWTYYDGQAYGGTGAQGSVSSIEESDLTRTVPAAPGNRITTYGTPDAYGHILSTTDAEGHTVSMTYDGTDKTFRTSESATTLSATGVPTTHLTTYGYDARFGVVTSVAPPGDVSRSFVYDNFGRLTKSWSDPLGTSDRPTTCYQYNLAARPVVITRFERDSDLNGDACGPNGMLGTATFLDGQGRRVQTKTEAAEPGAVSQAIESVVYNNEGRLQTSYQPYFSTDPFQGYTTTPPASALAAQFSYDPSGRPSGLTLPGVPTSTATYAGWTREDTDPEGKKVQTDVDAFGRAVARRTYDPLTFTPSTTTTIGYDPLGRLLAITDTNSNQIAYSYDAFGQLAQVVDPDAATTLRQYFKDGTVKQFTDAQNRVTTYTYDALQRVLVKTRSDGSTVTYGYDEAAGRPGSGPPIGHATSIQDSSTGIRQEFQYDQLGRLRLSRHVIDQTPYEISQILDSLGRTQALTYPDNSSIWYTYRADGRIGRVTSGPQWPVADNLKYTPAGEIGSILLGHGATVSNTYDATTAWLTRSLTSVPQYGSVVLDRTYGYTTGGHLASVTDNTDPAHPKSQTFTLDNLYRLTRASSPATYGTLDYGYDAIGNLRSKEGVGFNFQNGHPHQATSTSSGLTLQYDASGNLTSRSDAGSGVTRTFTYNLDGQLAYVKEAQNGTTTMESWYTYDPSGQRVKRVDLQGGVSTSTILLSDLYEVAQSGANRRFVYMGDHRIGAVTNTTEGISYYTGDRVGSLSAVMDDYGNVLSRIEYKPYGEIASMSGADASGRFLYAGARQDAATGLYDFGARFYDPSLGRFLTIDPLLGNPLDPRGLNPYGYALGNPASFSDAGGYIDPNVLRILVFTALSFTPCQGPCAMAVSGAVAGYVEARSEGKNVITGAIVGAAASYASYEAGASISLKGVGGDVLRASVKYAVNESVKRTYLNGDGHPIWRGTVEAAADKALDDSVIILKSGRNKNTQRVIDYANKYLKKQVHSALDRAEVHFEPTSDEAGVSPFAAFGDAALLQGRALPAGAASAFSSALNGGSAPFVASLRPGAVDPFIAGSESVAGLDTVRARTRTALERAISAAVTSSVLAGRNGTSFPIATGTFGSADGSDLDSVGVPKDRFDGHALPVVAK